MSCFMKWSAWIYTIVTAETSGWHHGDNRWCMAVFSVYSGFKSFTESIISRLSFCSASLGLFWFHCSVFTVYKKSFGNLMSSVFRQFKKRQKSKLWWQVVWLGTHHIVSYSAALPQTKQAFSFSFAAVHPEVFCFCTFCERVPALAAVMDEHMGKPAELDTFVWHINERLSLTQKETDHHKTQLLL